MKKKLQPASPAISAWFLVWTAVLILWSKAICEYREEPGLYIPLLILVAIAGFVAYNRYRRHLGQSISFPRKRDYIGYFISLLFVGLGIGVLFWGFSLYGVLGGNVEILAKSLIIIGLTACAISALGPNHPSRWLALCLSFATAISFHPLIRWMIAGREAQVYWLVRCMAVGAVSFWFLLMWEILPRTMIARVALGTAVILAIVSLTFSLTLYEPASGDQLIGEIKVPHAETLFWSRDGSKLYAGGADVMGSQYILSEFPVGKETQPASSQSGISLVLPGAVKVLKHEAKGGHACISPDDKTLLLTLERGNKNKEAQLILHDLATGEEKVIHRYEGSIYYPFSNEGDPWSPSGKRLLFYTSMLADKQAYVYDIDSATTYHLGSGRNWIRAFWLPEDRVCFAPEISGTTESATAFAVLYSSDYRGQNRSHFMSFPEMSLSYYYYADLKKLVVSGRKFTVWDFPTGQMTELAISNMKFLKTAWSPDGDRLAAPSDDRKAITVFEKETKKLQTIYPVVQNTQPVDQNIQVDSIVWSRPLNAIIFRMECQSSWVIGNSILMMEPDSWKVRRLASMGADSDGGFLRGNRDFLEMSPDHNRIVFPRRSPSGGINLYLIDLRTRV